MISNILNWFKQEKESRFDIDYYSEDYQDLQIQVQDLQCEIEELNGSLELKEKEYQNLLAKYAELKVRKDIESC